MIAKGTYRAFPVDAALGRTSTGHEQIVILLELADESGQRITWFGSFTDKTFDRTIASLRYLGWTGDNLADFASGLPEGVANEVEIVIDHETDQKGQVRARVRWINSGKGIAVKERLDEQEARTFGASMRGRIVALQAAKGQARSGHGAARQAPAAPRQTEPNVESSEDISSDEVPF